MSIQFKITPQVEIKDDLILNRVEHRLFLYLLLPACRQAGRNEVRRFLELNQKKSFKQSKLINIFTIQILIISLIIS